MEEIKGHKTEQPAESMANMNPLDYIEGYPVRPGMYQENGVTVLPGGVNFTVHSHGATACELLLYHRKENEPYAVLPFPEHYRIGDVYSMIVFGLDIEEFEYAYRLDGPYDPKRGLLFQQKNVLLDPYAKAVTGQSVWGVRQERDGLYHARVVRNDFDWGKEIQPLTAMSDTIIYELHVRGFTRDASSGVEHPGTFAGLQEKILYLKDLGITAVELMPIFEFDETMGSREVEGEKLLDYWGYNTVSFFAPNTSYAAASEYNREGTELKELIRELNRNHIEVILDVVFNHTAEGNEHGPFISFKGFDNQIYYMLTPDGYYYNFSGCGNTLNCNHPVVQQMILECLRYWVTDYRVDGFRFDLASILGRNEDGSPMSNPPLLKQLAFDPILGGTKLIAEAWDAGGLYQVGSFPAWYRWAEWNGRYRDTIRSYLKGDDGVGAEAVKRLTGSEDLYGGEYLGYNSSVNFLTCHDGFTLYDLYSYNEKHNEKNGWNNTDGCNDNRSWNCGAEGETPDQDILKLRFRMIKNACVMLMMSRGTPMFLAGDEFGNTQFGNNNAYCQDNAVSWLDWALLEKNRHLYEFFRYMIHFRREHKAVRKNLERAVCGLPYVSVHTTVPWRNAEPTDKCIGILYAGYDAEKKADDIVYVASNAYWEPMSFTLPELSEGLVWKLAVYTGAEAGKPLFFEESAMPQVERKFYLKERSTSVFLAVNVQS
ncbi:MAG: glycogen debranching enzyme [Lachnospiraceae bacterium]|nr:glycogen debranching enzyme [Lachnospiraceae bacterium]